MRRYLYIVIILGLSFSSWGQEESDYSIPTPQIFPPNPEAASLGKFGDVPVSLYTGIPNISIPIGTVQGSSLSVPISLAYHSSGIKVAQKAEQAGLGWSLIAGGQISRSVRGVPDEATGTYVGYLNNDDIVPDSNEFGDWFNDCNNLGLVENVASGYWDSQPDIFNFQIPGYSGKFFFGKDGQVHFSPHQPLSLEYNLSNDGQYIDSWVLTDPNGNRYSFGNPAFTETPPESSGGNFTASSTWYLLKMEDYNSDDEILFSYGTGYSTSSLSVSQSKSDCIPGTVAICPKGLSFNESYSTIHYFDVKTLSSITSSKGKFVFNYVFDRLDNLHGERDPRLSAISIYGNSQGTEVLKSYNLTHTYFGSTSNKYRLRLDQVSILNKNDEKVQEYLLSYNDINVSRDSKSVDWWGFFNSKNNSTYIPEDNFFSPTVLSGADRSPDIVSSQQGLLTSINYPTKGYTEFTYEPHTYYESPPPALDELVYPMEDNLNASHECPSSHCSPTSKKEVLLRLPSHNQIVDLAYSVRWKDGCLNSSIGLDPIDAKIALFEMNEVTNTYDLVFQTLAVASSNGGTLWQAGDILLQGRERIELQEGHNYKVVLTSNYQCIESNVAMNYYRGVTYDRLETEPVLRQNAGGARIASITNYDHTGTFIGKKKYDYDIDATETSGSYSSGLLTSKPKLGRVFRNFEESPSTCSQEARPPIAMYYTRNASSELINSAGAHIIYTDVTETQVDANNNPVGSKRTIFTADVSFNQLIFPYAPIKQDSWTRGFPLLEEVYAFDENGGQKKVQETTYEYEQVGEGYAAFGFVLQVKQPATNYFNCPSDEGGRCIGSDMNDYFAYTTYRTRSGDSFLKRKITKIYSTELSNSSFIESEQSFTYDSNHYQILEERNLNSKGQSINKKYFYCFNASLGELELATQLHMSSRNMNAVPIKEESWVNDVKTSGTRTTFMLQNSKLYRDAVYAYTSDNQEVKYLDYQSYGNKGEIKQYQLLDEGIITSFIWDNTRKIPLAQVTNATHDETAYTSFEMAGELGNWTASNFYQTTTAYTGEKAARGIFTKSGLDNGKEYVASCWIKGSAAPTVNGATMQVLATTASGWSYCEARFTESSTCTVNANNVLLHIDDLRLFPADAQMETSVYDAAGRVVAKGDANGNTVFYKYDDFNRLELIRDQDGNILKTFEYNYATE